MMADIFVSYASEDRERIRPLVEAMEAHGWSVWWDRDMHAGPRFARIIGDEISKARCVVVLWSEGAVDSDWVNDEAAEGRDRGVLVPGVIDDVRPPLGFRSIQTADLVGWPKEGQVSELLSGVAALLGNRTARTTDTGAGLRRGPSVNTRPEIGIVPFTCLSDDDDLRYLTDGVKADLIASMSGGLWNIVDATNSDEKSRSSEQHLRYTLSGAVQGGRDRVRVMVQLSEAEQGSELWAVRLDRSKNDLLDVQDDLAATIRTDLHAALMHVETRRISDVPLEQLNAYELTILANDIGDAGREQQSLLRRAVNLDPGFPFAHALLAWSYANTVLLSSNPDADARSARECLTKALEMDSRNPRILELCAYAHRVVGDERLGLKLAKRAADRLGRDSVYLYQSLIQAGQSEDVVRRGISPKGHDEMRVVGIASVVVGRYEDALEWFEESAAANPKRLWVWIEQANVLALLGRLNDAHDAWRHATLLQPKTTLASYESSIRINWRDNETVVQPLLAGLQQLGLD